MEGFPALILDSNYPGVARQIQSTDIAGVARGFSRGWKGALSLSVTGQMGMQKWKVKALFLGSTTEGVGKAQIKMPPVLKT